MAMTETLFPKYSKGERKKCIFITVKKCKKCKSEIEVDDVDFNFQGCQDEYLICKKNAKNQYLSKCVMDIFAKLKEENLKEIEKNENVAITLL